MNVWLSRDRPTERDAACIWHATCRAEKQGFSTYVRIIAKRRAECQMPLFSSEQKKRRDVIRGNTTREVSMYQVMGGDDGDNTCAGKGEAVDRWAGGQASAFCTKLRIEEFGVRLDCEWLAYEHSANGPYGRVGYQGTGRSLRYEVLVIGGGRDYWDGLVTHPSI